MSFDLSSETRSTIEQLGFLFEPENAAVSGGRLLRNGFFAWTGRAIYNFITDPTVTMQEISNISYDDQLKRLTDSNWLTTFLGRFIFQAFCLIVGITILFTFGGGGDGILNKSIENLIFF